MNEQKIPIPARLYNSAVGGHVCGPEDVDFGQKVIHLIKYDRAGNEVSFESQVTQANKIYVIHDDFTLSSNVTIPANCVLQFDGGSISGAYTVTGQNTGIQAGLIKIFNIDITFVGTWNVAEVYPEWFGAKTNDNTFDNTAAINKCQDICNNISLNEGTYYVSSHITQTGGRNVVLYFPITCIIKGKGQEKTIIKYNGSSDVIILYLGWDNIEISGFTIEGKGVTKTIQDVYNTYVCNGIGILFKRYNMRLGTKLYANNITVRNIEIGIRSSSYMTKLSLIRANNCLIGIDTYAADNGDGGTSITNTTFTIDNCDATDCQLGINLYRLIYSSIRNCGMDNITLYGYNITNCIGLSLIGCGTEGCTGRAVNIKSCIGLNLIGCRIGYTRPNDNDGVIVGDDVTSVYVLNSVIYSEAAQPSNAAIRLINRGLNATYSFIIDGGRIDGYIKNESDWKNIKVVTSEIINPGDNFPSAGSMVESFSNGVHKKVISINGSPLLDACGYFAARNSGTTDQRPTGLSAGLYYYGLRYFDTTIKRQLHWNGTKYAEYDEASAGVKRSGATTDRPVGTDIYTGFMFMDTTLGKPIYASAISGDTVTWVDATGATV